MSEIRILALGDVVGESGTLFIREKLWNFRKENNIDAVIVNGENSGNKGGIDIDSAELLLAAGADVITTGNHVWRDKRIGQYLEDTASVLRPANYPDSCPGRGHTVVDVKGYRMMVINVMGTVFMESLESPFERTQRILEREKGNFDFALVDFHAEATSEKLAFGINFDSQVSAIFGTHTHIQTNDARIFKGGTGYITDLGMTGVYDSVLGIEAELMIKKFITKIPQYHNTAKGDITMSGVIFTLDSDTFKCKKVETVNLKG